MVKNIRQCGSCSECCIVYSIDELKKPQRVPCKHLGCNGCNIYDSKPKVCNDFLCEWKHESGLLNEEERPDIIGAIFRKVKSDGRGKGFSHMIMAHSSSLDTWQPSNDRCNLKALAVAERLSKKYPVVLIPSSVTIGPWDEEGNLLPSAEWVINADEAHRVKPKRDLSATESVIFSNCFK